MMPANGCLAIICLRLCNECNKIAIKGGAVRSARRVALRLPGLQFGGVVGPASVAPPGIKYGTF